MQTGKGQVAELLLRDGLRSARLSCPVSLIPAPGQYMLAGDDSSSLLPAPLFYTDSAPSGFIAAAPVPAWWTPGTELHLRGPFGRGFTLPLSARRVALIAFDDSPARLQGLIQAVLKQGAAVVLIGDSETGDLPDEVEVQPRSAIGDILEWCDYVALDVARENLNLIRELLTKTFPWAAGRVTEMLIRTPMPCGGVAECGVCAITLKSVWKLVCKDGPVFDAREFRT